MLWFDFTMSVSSYVSTFTWQLLKKKVCLQMFGCHVMSCHVMNGN